MHAQTFSSHTTIVFSFEYKWIAELITQAATAVQVSALGFKSEYSPGLFRSISRTTSLTPPPIQYPPSKLHKCVGYNYLSEKSSTKLESHLFVNAEPSWELYFKTSSRGFSV